MALHGILRYIPSLQVMTEWDEKTFSFVSEARRGPPNMITIKEEWYTTKTIEVVTMIPFGKGLQKVEAGDLLVIPSNGDATTPPAKRRSP